MHKYSWPAFLAYWGSGDFNGGITKSVNDAFFVDKSETNLILIYAPFLGNEAFMSAGQ